MGRRYNFAHISAGVYDGDTGGQQPLSILVFMDDAELFSLFHHEAGYRRRKDAFSFQKGHVLSDDIFAFYFIKLFAGLVDPDGKALCVVDKNGVADAVQNRDQFVDGKDRKSVFAVCHKFYSLQQISIMRLFFIYHIIEKRFYQLDTDYLKQIKII